MELLYTETMPLAVNGRTLDATVRVYTETDQDGPEGGFDFGDAKANADYLARFERGTLQNILIKVEVSALGLDADDYLGACHVRTRYFDKDVRDTVRDHGMIAEAADTLRDSLTAVVAAFA